MELRIGQATLADPLSLETLFSLSSTSNGHGLLGLFDHLSGVTLAHYEPNWPDIINLESLSDEIQATLPTPSEFALSYVLKRTALIHELRHFHDCFLTPAGVQLLETFGLAYGMIGSIARELIVLSHTAGQPILSPVLQLLKEDHLPHSLHGALMAFRDSYRTLFILGLNIGATPLAFQPGQDFESDFYRLTVVDDFGSQYEVPCANLNVLIDGKWNQALWPLGFCLVSECLATLEQVPYFNDISRSFGDQFFNSFRIGWTPYLPLHMTFTRILRARGVDVQNNASYERLLYESLWRSLFATGGTITPSLNGARPTPGFIGNDLIRQLQENVEVSHGDLKWMPAPLERETHIHTSSFKGSGLPDLFLSYVRHEYLNKALAAEEFDGLRYGTREWYMGRLGTLPLAPIVLTSQGEISVNDRQFLDLWLNWMFFRDLAHRSLFSDIFVCPVRHPQTSVFFKPYDLFPSGDICRTGLSEFSCGAWKAGTQYKGPDCFWTRHLGQMFGPLIGKADNAA